MKFNSKCILSFVPLGAVLCSDAGVAPSGSATVQEQGQEHVCSINYGSQVLASKVQDFESRIGMLIFSENGEMLNKGEVSQKIGGSEGVMPMIIDDTELTIDDMANRIAATFISPTDEKYNEYRDNSAIVLRKVFEKMDLSSELEKAISAVKEDQSPMSIALTRVKQVISMMNEIGFIKATDFCGVYKEIAISLFVDICDSYHSLLRIQGQPQSSVLENPRINDLAIASQDFANTIFCDNIHCSTTKVAIIEKFIAMEKLIKEIVQDESLMAIASTCAFPECSGNYNALSEEEKQRIFLIAKKAGVMNTLSMFAMECLKKHVDPDYMTSTEDMEYISYNACIAMLFLADLHRSVTVDN